MAVTFELHLDSTASRVLGHRSFCCVRTQTRRPTPDRLLYRDQ